MRKVIYKSLLLLLALMIIKFLARSVVPHTYQDNHVEAKWEALKVKKNTNLVILGTSRIQWGIDPSVLDSLSGGFLRSFNMGIPKYTIPYSTDRLMEKLDQVEHEVKYVLVEVITPNLESNDLWRGIKFYSVNVPDEIPATKIILVENIYEKFHQLIGLQPEIMAFTKEVALTTDGLPINYLDFDDNGYRKVEENQIKNYTQIRSTVNDTKEFYGRVYNDAGQRHAPWSNMAGLISSFRERGIALLFLLSPMVSGEETKFVSEIFKGIPREHILFIDTAIHFDIIKQPDLHQDGTHFNHQGAVLYSENIAKALMAHGLISSE